MPRRSIATSALSRPTDQAELASIASYAVVHMPPGQKILIEVVPTAVEPDMDLLAQRKLGLRR